MTDPLFFVLSNDCMVNPKRIIGYKNRKLYLDGLKEPYFVLTEEEDKKLIKILEVKGMIDDGEEVI